MDPLSAFGLACGVTQVVDFATKISGTYKELQKHGSLRVNDDLEDFTRETTSLLVSLEPPAPPASEPNLSLPVQDELLALSRKCQETAKELLQELSELKSTRKRDILWKVPATMKRKKVLESLESRLESYRKVIDTRILVNLRQPVGEIIHSQGETLSRLDHSSQVLASFFAGNSASFDELARMVRDENRSTTNNIVRYIKELDERAENARYEKQLLDSLHFPEINCREEEIHEIYEDTFKWILDHHGERLPSQSNFVDWLEKGNKIYWINGKAGSGKSTLMNYIWRDQKTRDHLMTWAGQHRLIVPGSFFWASGSPLQKTLVGLLRSLIYQILQKSPELMIISAETPQDQDLPFPFGPKHELMTVWTEKRLRHYFSLLADRASSTCRICLFIDGLDEFGGKHRELVEFLLQLVQNSAIKCCVSSRTERPFDGLGASSIALRLEDLTRQDIERYVRGKLDNMTHYDNTSFGVSLDTIQRDIIVRSIIKKAEGVFLWVELVVDMQITMIQNEDDFDMLLSHLNALPDEVEELYTRMLDRVDRRYRAEAARYLQYTKPYDDRSEALSVFDMSIAEFGLNEKLRLERPSLDPEFIISKCGFLRKRIRLVCAGLLEIREGKVRSFEEWQSKHPSSSRRTFEIITGFGYAGQKVYFYHRTVAEFLQEGNPDMLS